MQRTRNYIKFYSFALFALLIVTACKKDDIKIFENRIVSASLDKVIISDTTNFIEDVVEIDLNNDGETDYSFFYKINSTKINESDFYLYVIANGENELLIKQKTGMYNYVNALKLGEQFSGNWGSYYGDLVNRPLDMPWENAGPKYLGFRIYNNNKYYTGWLKLEIGKKGCKIIFYDYAYRLDNGNRMYAGER